jgi:hypothetical protein
MQPSWIPSTSLLNNAFFQVLTPACLTPRRVAGHVVLRPSPKGWLHQAIQGGQYSAATDERGGTLLNYTRYALRFSPRCDYPGSWRLSTHFVSLSLEEHFSIPHSPGKEL